MHALTLKLREEWRDAVWTDAALVLLFSVLFWASKWAGKIIDELPGHSGAFWIPVLLVSACTVRRPGVSTLTAMLGGLLWCFPKGGGAGALAPYVAAGLLVDVVNRSQNRLALLPVALAAGVLAHLAKFGFHNLPRLILGAPSDFMTVGLAGVAGLHVLFGLIGGLAGWLLISIMQRRKPSASNGAGAQPR